MLFWCLGRFWFDRYRRSSREVELGVWKVVFWSESLDEDVSKEGMYREGVFRGLI